MAKAKPVWPPYRRMAQDTAKDWYDQFGGDRADLAGAVFANPIDSLLAYLRQPSRAVWGRRAKALVGGLLSDPEPLAEQVTAQQARNVLSAALGVLGAGGSPRSAKATAGGDGEILVLHATDEHGLPLLYTVAPSGDDSGETGVGFSALAVLDDRAESLGTDEHKLRWRAWLYWSNLLQFLAFTGGDGVQLATSQAAKFPVDVLTVGGGIGELETLIASRHPEPADEATVDAHGMAADAAIPSDPCGTAAATSLEKVVAGLARDATWDEDIIVLLEEDEPHSDLTLLAKKIAERGKKAPSFGYELGERGWQADFAWTDSDVKVAVVVDVDGHDSEEQLKRDAAYAAEGWTVRTATSWLDHLDTLLTLLPDTEGPTSR
jgi:hypothetical protein